MTFADIKEKAAEKETAVLVQCLIGLEAKTQLEEHERLVRAAICDAIEDKEGVEFIEALLDKLEAA